MSPHILSSKFFTPSNVLGLVLDGHGMATRDATKVLMQKLLRVSTKDRVLEWLVYSQKEAQQYILRKQLISLNKGVIYNTPH